MTDETPEVISKTAARQGVTPHVMRYVLTYGLGGAIVVLVLVYLVFFGH